MATTPAEALVHLALAEGALKPEEGKKLRKHIAEAEADAPAIERLMVQFHKVSPERARALRERAEADPEGVVRPAAPEPAPPLPDADALLGELESRLGDGTPCVVVVFPLAEGAPPTDAQRAAATEAGPGDLSDPLPRIVRAGPRGELRPLVERLRQAGLDAEAVAPPAMGLSVLVRRARVEEATLKIATAEGDLEIDLAKPTCLVLGRGNKRPGKTRFAHLYVGGREGPFEVHEKTAFPNLLSQRDPFQAFVESVQAQKGVTSSDLLLTHAERVEESTPAFELPSPPATNTASSHAVALSRVLYETWLAAARFDPAHLRPAVVLVRDHLGRAIERTKS